MIPRLLPLSLLLLAVTATAWDVEYSTTGAMDLPATAGGDRDFWGSDFMTRWDNTTGADVMLEEFGWPCGGWWSQFWYVWITDTLPAGPFGLEYYGSFVAASADETEYPPSLYTYIDVSAEAIVIPAGESMYFGYGNPGMGGQISFNGTQTWSYLDGGWDMDGDFGRTAVMQFRGSFASTPVDGVPGPAALLGARPNPFNPSTTIAFSLPREMAADLCVYAMDGRAVRKLASGVRSAGMHEVAWDGADETGRTAPSGVYLVRITTEDGVDARKVIMAK